MTSPRYKVAIIGSTGRGDYGHGLDGVWKTLPECEVVGVADPDPAGLAKAIERVGAPQGYADYRQMLDQQRPQIVAICPRWVDQHRDLALACAEYGCHMYMEKPLCRTMGEADQIVRACEMRHLKVAVAHLSRYSPVLAQVKRLIADGVIGDVLEIRARGKEDARGGVEDLWVLGTHVLDLMRAYAGEPESCFASLYEGKTRAQPAQIRPGNEGLGPMLGTRVDASYHFSSGVTGYFNSQKGAGGNPNRFGLRIYGSKGVIDHISGYGRPAYLIQDARWGAPGVDAAWQPITSRGLNQPETITDFDYAGVHPVAARDLIDAIEKDREPLCSIQHARGAVEMVLAALESHRQGQPVPFPMVQADHPFTGWK
jgi:predicted dehydrogenase